MDKRVIFRASAFAALVGTIAVLVMAGASFSAGADVNLQPGSIPVSDADFVRGINDYTDASALFFTGDSMFILSYLLVFVGLYTVTADEARPFAAIGLGAGILTAALDASENAFLITLVLAAKNGIPATDSVPAVYVLTNLKWMAAFATLFAFGLVFPRRTPAELALVVLMLAFPLVGVLGIVQQGLIAVRGLFFLVGMPLFAWYFWQRIRETRYSKNVIHED